ncbi:MAG TPA: site-2 protease family protein [Gemmatimonadales bacterium]|nr:site-2 protease family protein [Gemmatimonadales bacterium]
MISSLHPLPDVPDLLVHAVLGPLTLAYVAAWIALYVHEIGHATMARALGVRIWGVRLGIGPAVFDGVVAGCQLRIGILPLAGSVALLDADAAAIGYRGLGISERSHFEWVHGAWRAPLISAAGGISNLFGALAVIANWSWSGQPALGTPLGDLALYAVVANLAGYLNLLPCFSSDGRHLLQQLSAVRRRVDARTDHR